MSSFFKMFFASLLSIIVFCLVGIFLLLAVVSQFTSKEKPDVAKNSVLMLDLGQHFKEQHESQPPFNALSQEGEAPGLFDVVRLIQHAKTDDNIAGIYIKAENNANSFASSNEIRNAILDFKKSKKFVLAQGDVMSQQAYFIASAADKVYVNPAGQLDWSGYSVTLPFLKGMLDKLEIKAQIFYAGKFKSATEIFRVDKMTPENRLQTLEWLGDMYRYFLVQSGKSRGIDTATLHGLANNAAIQTPQDAVAHKLIDGVKYDDQVKDEIKRKLGIGKYDKMNLLPMNSYNESVSLRKTGSNRIAVIYAEGDIVDGMGSNNNIGGDNFRNIIRKVRLDKSVKAIVLRVNSGGGSALASENIWRELHLAKEDGKPVVVSFGDVAASGGYYISCGADSIFANPNTITGSIGVFGIIPNMESFFKDKLGVTFDGVKTAPYADAGSVYRPLNETEQRLVQAGVDRTYLQFKQRVAQGRKKDVAYIDSIAQGRVWSGEDALQLGLVDKLGNLQDAINCASRMSKLQDYGIKEYPERQSWINEFINKKKSEPEAMVKQQVGEENFRIYQQLIRIKQMTGSVQARLPFDFITH
jgi:protease IV